jgi:hypothetical protein
MRWQKFFTKKYAGSTMASHFQWYPSSEEVVVPFNARYSFPSQANKAVKVTPRIPPVSGTTFTPSGGPIKITLPAQGYMNPRNTTLTFDVTLTSGTDASFELTRFQNNIQSIFSRVRLMYGSTPLEDIPNYNVIMRQLTEWTGTNQIGVMDQTSINEGIGGVTFGTNVAGSKNPGVLGNVYFDGSTPPLTTGLTANSVYALTPAAAAQEQVTTLNPAQQFPVSYNSTYSSTVATKIAGDVTYALNGSNLVNTRQKYIQGIDFSNGAAGSNLNTKVMFINQGCVPNTLVSAVASNQYSCTRRYTIRLGLGLFNQDKLIPLKWMASQLSVELTLAPAASCLFTRVTANTGTATYAVSNVNLIPEILEFDASYDAMFLKGLREGGVPIKFSTWHTYAYNVGGQNNVNFIIPEKSRSVKSVFTIQRRGTDVVTADSGAAFFCSGTTNAVGAQGTLQSFQYRIGGRYFPAAPVQTSLTPSSAHSNGGAEALVELQKALNTLGDSRLSVNVNTMRWALPNILCRTYDGTGSNVAPPTGPQLSATTYPTTMTKVYHSGTGFGSFNRAIPAIILNEADFSGGEFGRWDVISGGASYGGTGWPSAAQTTDTYGDAWMVMPPSVSAIGSTQFCAAIDLETSSGLEISGLNAEEQSDIAFIAQYSSNQATDNILEAYVYFDAMMVLRENNVLELIQ